MSTVFVVPAAGALVRHPDTMTPLSAGGENVELTTYWRRRISDGSVVVVDNKPAEAQAVEQIDTESARSDKQRRNRN